MDNKRDTYLALRCVCACVASRRVRESGIGGEVSRELRAEVFAPLFQLQLLLPLPLALPLHFRSPSRFTTEIPGPNRKNPSNSKGNQHGAGGGGGGGGSGGVGNADADANDILKLKQQVKVTYQPEDDELYGSSEDFDDGEFAGLPPLSPHHYYTSGNKPPTHKPGAGGQHHHHSQQTVGGSGGDRERERGGGGGGGGGNIELAFGNTRKPTYYGGSGVAGGVGAASAAGGGIAGGGGVGGMDNTGVRHGGPMDNNELGSGCASWRHAAVAAAWRQPLLMGLSGLVAALRLL